MWALMVHVRTWLLPGPLPGGASFLSPAMTMYEPPADAPEAPESEARRVQVVARWNSWVQVFDPSDETLTWVDLAETSYAQA
mgnify:CR=1 FL=1